MKKLIKKFFLMSVLGFTLVYSNLNAVGWGTGVGGVNAGSDLNQKRADVNTRLQFLVNAGVMTQDICNQHQANVLGQDNGLLDLFNMVLTNFEQLHPVPVAVPVAPAVAAAPVAAPVAPALAAAPAPAFFESTKAFGEAFGSIVKSSIVVPVALLLLYLSVNFGLPEAQLLWTVVSNCWRLGFAMLPQFVQSALPGVDLALVDPSCVAVTSALLQEKVIKVVMALVSSGLFGYYTTVSSWKGLKGGWNMFKAGRDMTRASWNNVKKVASKVKQVVTWPVR